MKKFISIATLLAFVFSMMTLPAQAEYTARLADDFDTAGQVGSVKYSSGDYYESANGLFIKQTCYNTWSNHITVSADMGFNGSAGLYLHADEDKKTSGAYRMASTMTKGMIPTDEKGFILSYKVRFIDVSSSGFSVHLSSVSPAGKGAFFTDQRYAPISVYSGTFKTGSTTKAITANEWYTVVTKVLGAGTEKEISSYILDDDNNLYLSSVSSVPSGTYTENGEVNFWPVYVPDNLEKETHLVIDDVVLTEYVTTSGASLEKSSVTDGEEDVQTLPTITLDFDQAVNAVKDDIKLYKTNTPAETVSITATQSGFNRIIVTPESELVSGENYTLDISGVKNTANVALSSQGTSKINFKTMNPDAIPAVFTGAKLSNGAALTDGMTNVGIGETVTLGFETEVAELAEGDVTLTTNGASVEAKAEKNNNSIVVTPSAKLNLNTSYTIDFSKVKSISGGNISGTDKISFTTQKTREILYYEENLENAVEGTDIYYHTNNILDTHYHSFTVKDGIGVNKTKGIECKINKESAILYTNKFEVDPSETLILEYKLNLQYVEGMYLGLGVNQYSSTGADIFKLSASNNVISILGNSGGSPALETITPGEWYTVIFEISKDLQKGYILDKNGRQVDMRSYSGRAFSNPRMFHLVSSVDSSMDAKFDDIRLYRVSSHSLQLDETKSDVYGGMTEVKPAKEIKLVFNQPLGVGAENNIKLYKGNSEVDITVAKDSNTVIITPEISMTGSSTYKIDLSSVNSLTGNTFAEKEIVFSTKKIYPVNAISSTLAISDAGEVALGNKTIQLENTSEAISNAVIMVAVYSDDRPKKLVGVEIFKNINIGESEEKTVQLALKKSYNNVGSVEFMLFDSLSNRKPYMFSYKVSK